MQHELPHFEHVDAHSVDEAVYWLTRCGARAKVIAGGTDLLGLMKDRIAGPGMALPEVLVDIKSVPELRRIEDEEGRGIRIGSAVTLLDLEAHPAIRAKFPALAQAAASVGTTQIRSMGTIGGNLCQRPWCTYFRHPQYVCFKRGGRQCYAISGHNRYYSAVTGLGICVMSHPSDVAPALIALDARLVIAGPKGARTVPVEEFFRGARSAVETVLRQNELVSRIEIAEGPQATTSVFLKKRVRGTWDFALSAVAVAMTKSGRVCDDIRVVLSGIAPAPFRATGAEGVLRGNAVSEALIARSVAQAISKPRPLKMNAYKITLTRTLLRRALTAVTDGKVAHR